MLDCRIIVIGLLCMASLGAARLDAAQSHYLLSGMGGGWQVGSFRAVEESPTKNQYSYYGQFFAGYSFEKQIDAKLFLSYRPLNKSGATLDSADSQQLFYGAELGVRFVRGVYAGVRVGDTQLKSRSPKGDNEYGIWTGISGGFVLGGYFDIDNTSKVTLAVVVETSQLQRDSDSSRPWDSYLVQISYDFFDRLK